MGARKRLSALLSVLVTLAGVGVVFVPAAASAEDADLLLVLAVDVSRSIDATKFQLQREGYAAAISDPHVLDAIHSGRTGRIALTLVEWSGVGAQKVVVDWTMIGDASSAKAFGDRLLEASATARWHGIPIIPIRPAAWPNTTVTMSSAGRPRSSWSPKTSTRSARRS